MDQEVKLIKVKDLVLWTENPRDPIDESASDLDVVNRAMSDPNSKWDLKKLARDMGEYYDFSELPIVVYQHGKPVVYDGNRRVVLAKIKLGLIRVESLQVQLPNVPDELPCNVCSEEIALKSVYRKHVTLRNSWGTIERDVFAHKYLKEKKSAFLMFDEGTDGFISKNPIMNQGFVRNEVFTDTILGKMGFSFKDGYLMTRHSDDEVRVLLENLLEKIQNNEISTRGPNRGKPINALDQRVKDIIHDNASKEYRRYITKINIPNPAKPEDSKEPFEESRKTRITKPQKPELFGGKLVLQPGNVNNLYSDILILHGLVTSHQKSFSGNLYSLLRMSLRLLCETASIEKGHKDIKDYIDKYGAAAKKRLNQDTKTLLSSQNVKLDTLPQLLHTGAHNYTSSTSFDQALCISILLGVILTESHGKGK